jgi:tetratricopeptide (TPR) repeat protein
MQRATITRAGVWCLALVLFFGTCPKRLSAQEPPLRIVEAAREAARNHRNAEAAALLAEALSIAPELRRELLLELAEQLTYSGRAAEAVPLFHEVLAWPPSPEEGRRARLGLALALSWSDQLSAALREYEQVLAEHPDDIDARLGRARILSWRGRLGAARAEYNRVLRQEPGSLEALRSGAQVQSWRRREFDALERLGAILRDHPEDVETLLILPQVQEARGRPDLALPAVDRLLVLQPDHARALEFRSGLLLRGRPWAQLEVRTSSQTDDLDITALSLTQSFPIHQGRSSLAFNYRQLGFAQPRPGIEEVTIVRPGFLARHRIGDRSEINVGASLDMINPAGAPARNRPFTYDAWLTLWPADGLRVDISSSRATFDNIRSLVTPVVATYAGLSADLTPHEMTRVSGRASRGSFSDGNTRLWGQLEAEQRAWNFPQVLLGVRATGMRFDQRLDGGYFNPERYISTVATARAWHGWQQRTWVNAGGSYGREQSTPGGTKPVWSIDARVSHWLTQRVEVEAAYDYFSSRQFFGTAVEGPDDRGWARQTMRAGLRLIW